MKIAGIERNSFVDYPGKLAAVLFTPGCNLDCFYCHNRHLLTNAADLPRLDCEVVLEWLAARRGFLEGVVITGGEPTLQPDLPDFVRRLRALGYPVKLDTNGTRPHVLTRLVEGGLLDFAAMDVKAPIEAYEAVCGVPVDHSAVNTAIDLLLSGGIDYEFRTTLFPQLTENDLVSIARRVRGAKRLVLQQYRKPTTAPEYTDARLDAPPRPADWAVGMVDRLSGFVEQCVARGFGVEASPRVAAP